jgi:6-pyruvoyltetrahydropterin/6-carboxytetrahydropterin synthase
LSKIYEITVKGSFCGAHSLRYYRGKCEALHGHNWRVEATVYGNKLGKTGMLLDFTVLKARLEKVISALDHKHLNEIPFFKKQNPTSENIARYIHSGLMPLIRKKMTVSVEETDSSRASYTAGP